MLSTAIYNTYNKKKHLYFIFIDLFITFHRRFFVDRFSRSFSIDPPYQYYFRFFLFFDGVAKANSYTGVPKTYYE